MAKNTKGQIGVTTENIFPVIKQFLYSDHEIFLRELVANAVDASQKLKVLASAGAFKGETGELKVNVELDEKKKTLRITDSGIGMTAEELDKYINQIAFSSAGEFLEKYKDQTNIIGHFGLGFYSAFMVAKKGHDRLPELAGRRRSGHMELRRHARILHGSRQKSGARHYRHP